jgi:hypothetical protein
MKEGDTPSWFYFLPHGLNDPAHPEWGGWGGRFTRTEEGVYRDAHDTVGDTTDARATVWRWRPAFQADFQARLDWCLAQEYAKANHNPAAVLNGDRSRKVVELSAKPGEGMRLSAEGSKDPDGNGLRARWSIYREAGTHRGDVRLSDAEGLATTLTAPDVTEARTVHVILELRDDGKPPLYAYRRAVVTVRPAR